MRCRDKDKRGRYRILPVQRWIEANVLGRDAEEVDWARLRKAEADERQARAKIAQMKVELIRGELVTSVSEGARLMLRSGRGAGT